MIHLTLVSEDNDSNNLIDTSFDKQNSILVKDDEPPTNPIIEAYAERHNITYDEAIEEFVFMRKRMYQEHADMIRKRLEMKRMTNVYSKTND